MKDKIGETYGTNWGRSLQVRAEDRGIDQRVPECENVSHILLTDSCEHRNGHPGSMRDEGFCRCSVEFMYTCPLLCARKTVFRHWGAGPSKWLLIHLARVSSCNNSARCGWLQLSISCSSQYWICPHEWIVPQLAIPTLYEILLRLSSGIWRRVVW
jgi:hypothetical protein